MRSRRIVLALAALLLPATLHGATPPNPPAIPGRTFLTGQLLIASPDIGDPRFHQTVIVMVRHNAEGALGIVINRPLGERPLASVLEAIGEKSEGATGSVPIYLGGPVDPERGIVLHSADYRGTGTLDIDGRIAMTGSLEIIRDIAAGSGPKKSLIAFGYAGWGPGQLEGELARNAWFTAPIESKLVFDEVRDDVWKRAMERRTRDL
jgi:putative transcriptional regulator